VPETRPAINPPNGRPFATPFPTPDERSARPVDDARTQLAQIDGLGEVIAAAEAADVSALLALAQPGIIRCAEAGRTAPSECAAQPTAELVSVTQVVGASRLTPRPVTRMERRLHQMFDKNAPSLVFASRDGTLPVGAGGRYFLVFKAPQVLDPESGADAIGLIVSPGRDHPIESFTFILPAYNGLEWIQLEAPHSQVLITPESVQSWPGRGYAQ
jgi:hypothetical protein